MDQFALSCSADLRNSAYDDVYATSKKIRPAIDPVLDTEYIWVLRCLANKTHMHPPLRLQVSDIVTCLVSCAAISSEVTSASILDLKTFIRISRVLFRPFSWKAELLNPEVSGRQYDQRRKLQEALAREEWYATAEDIARVWTNVFRHRTKLNPQSEQLPFALIGDPNAALPVPASMAALEDGLLHIDQQKVPPCGVVPRSFEHIISRCA
ncbi:hypothetical protein QFC22_005993 [Naganishia vaughanmartiniae]|uniref:Uncharacterized protein n=1 Tax=Naganishia vaughanmartiniae TaxID=1424756 RepID=A0ACC2WR97_9TREE|nr:hypothetical protein QFC22_005993 [Naganishia vaughanmartiniae]